MKEEKKEKKLEQLKWLYAGLSGVCVAFFFALLSQNIKPTESSFLLFASICFAILLPVFVGFTLAHILIIEIREKDKSGKVTYKKIDDTLNKKWVSVLTQCALYLLAIAFLSLALHFSVRIAFFMVLSGLLIFVALKKFILQLLN